MEIITDDGKPYMLVNIEGKTMVVKFNETPSNVSVREIIRDILTSAYAHKLERLMGEVQ